MAKAKTQTEAPAEEAEVTTIENPAEQPEGEDPEEGDPEEGEPDEGGDNDGDAEDAEVKVRRDIVPPQYRKIYQELGGNCGDFIAAELSAMVESGGLDSLNSVKTENDIPIARWGTLNNGQQRMNLSNILRANFLRGMPIKICGKVFDINTMRDEFGGLDVDDAEELNKFLKFISMPESDRNRKAIIRVFKTLPEAALAKAKREEAAQTRREEKAKKAEEDKLKAAEAKLKAEQEKVDGTATTKKPRKAKTPEALEADAEKADEEAATADAAE